MRVLILSTHGFEDTELLVPLYRLREARIDVDVAAPEHGAIEGKHGYRVEATHSIGGVRTDDYDLLILPGGKAPATLRKDERALALVQQFFAAGKPVAAICHGPQILASAGVLAGRTVTAYPKVQAELAAEGIAVRDEEVVVDGNLITSRQPEDLPAFCREIMRVLG